MKRPDRVELALWVVLIAATLVMMSLMIRPVWRPLDWAKGIDDAVTIHPPPPPGGSA